MRAKVHGCSKMQMEYEIFYFVLGPTFVMYYCKFTRDRAWGDQAKDQQWWRKNEFFEEQENKARESPQGEHKKKIKIDLTASTQRPKPQKRLGTSCEFYGTRAPWDLSE